MEENHEHGRMIVIATEAPTRRQPGLGAVLGHEGYGSDSDSESSVSHEFDYGPGGVATRTYKCKYSNSLSIDAEST